MTAPSILGIALRTSSVKLVLTTPRATVLAQPRQTYRVTTPGPGRAESDPEELAARRDRHGRPV